MKGDLLAVLLDPGRHPMCCVMPACLAAPRWRGDGVEQRRLAVVDVTMIVTIGGRDCMSSSTSEILKMPSSTSDSETRLTVWPIRRR